MGYVYAIRMTTTDYVKIGKSENVERRLQLLQIGNPLPLVIEYTMFSINTGVLESELHNRLQKYNTHGEWFSIKTIDLVPILEQTYLDHRTNKIIPFRNKNKRALRTFILKFKDGYTRNILAENYLVDDATITFYDQDISYSKQFNLALLDSFTEQ